MLALRTATLLLIAAHVWMSVARGADAPAEANARVVEALNATEWIYALDSARIDATIRSTRPPETVELNKRKFVKELRDLGAEIPDEIPDEVIRERGYLQPASEATLVLSWDRKRLVQRFDLPGCLTDIVIWDGLQGRAQQKWGTRQNGFSLHPQPPSSINQFFSSLPWALTADHYAPLQVDAEALRELAVQRAEARKDETALQFHSVVTFDDVECELYARPEVGSWDRVYVEQASGRLRGVRVGSWGTVAAAIALPFTREVLAERGISVDTTEEAEEAVRQLPAPTQAELWKEMHARLKESWWKHVPDFDPIWTVTLNDWREVRPGCWFPFRQQNFTHPGGTSRPQGEETSVTTIDRFDANEPLEEELLVLTIDEGADVYDATSDPPLRYTQDSNRTPEEWARIMAKARESHAEHAAEQASLDALIGTPAPAFPETKWLHSEALTWEQLQGRYVLLDFWHIGCGPCWNSLGWMSALHAKRDAPEGVTVIGIHGEGVEPETIRDELAKRSQADMSFPICIDQPLGDGVETDAFPSVLFSQLHVRRMPYAWLVGPDGTLIAHGDLPTLHERALSLMRAGKK